MAARILIALAALAAATQPGWGQKKPKKTPAQPSPVPSLDPPAISPPAPEPLPTIPPLDPPAHLTPSRVPPAAPDLVTAQPETVDTILKRLSAIRAERDNLAREEAALKDRLRHRIKEQAELMKSLGVDPGASPPPATQATTASVVPALYFPATVGAERVFLIGGREVRDVVTAVERDGDTFVVTLAKPDEPGGEPRVISVSKDKVLILRNGDLRYQPPHVALLPTAKVGTTWHLFGTPGEGEAHRLAGAERVTVPAGTFDALRVDYGPDGAGPVGSLWYAPGVGSVKNTRGGRDVLLLMSFKPDGGAAPPVGR